MPSALVHFFARLICGNRRPFHDDMEVAGNLEKRVERQWPGLRNGFFHGQDTDDVIAYTQVVAFCLDIRIDHLVVEKLR